MYEGLRLSVNVLGLSYGGNKEIIFRWHRGLLKESMESCVSVSDLDEVRAIAKGVYPVIDTLEVSYYGYDDRIKWECYTVMVNGWVIGWMNGDFK